MGCIFDIKEMAVFDGPNLRTTVFFKGCPLRCQWCHNPEGLSIKPQMMVSKNGCIHCGKCGDICPSPDHCVACGECAYVCPRGLRRMVGTEYTAEELARILLRDAEYLRSVGGGYTLSGGEPTMQPDFMMELLGRLRGNHRAAETCGYASPDIFHRMVNELDLVIMDIKIVNPDLHKRYTGADNAPILNNLGILRASKKPFIIRVPLIPGISDTEENLTATADFLSGSENLERVELLPYHQAAGAKYSLLGKEYRPEFDTLSEIKPNIAPFIQRGIECIIL